MNKNAVRCRIVIVGLYDLWCILTSNKYLTKHLEKSAFLSMCLEFVFFHGSTCIEVLWWQRLERKTLLHLCYTEWDKCGSCPQGTHGQGGLVRQSKGSTDTEKAVVSTQGQSQSSSEQSKTFWHTHFDIAEVISHKPPDYRFLLPHLVKLKAQRIRNSVRMSLLHLTWYILDIFAKLIEVISTGMEWLLSIIPKP